MTAGGGYGFGATATVARGRGFGAATPIGAPNRGVDVVAAVVGRGGIGAAATATKPVGLTARKEPNDQNDPEPVVTHIVSPPIVSLCRGKGVGDTKSQRIVSVGFLLQYQTGDQCRCGGGKCHHNQWAVKKG